MTTTSVNEAELSTDVLIIGAGPSGSMAAALLHRGGVETLIVERQKFPRFSLGESLLPQSMVFLEAAGLLDAVAAGNYQHKNGAAFRFGDRYAIFDFQQKFSEGPGTTYQVKRADFDKRLADAVERMGVPVHYEHEVLAIAFDNGKPVVSVRAPDGSMLTIRAQRVLDASGFGRVLSRLLELEYPSDFPSRRAVFCHVEDQIDPALFDRQKILITVNATEREIWYWLIPFSDGTSSVGVVGEQALIESYGADAETQLDALLADDEALSRILANARKTIKVNSIQGYSCNVRALHGEGYALLGNAGEFLDPVFSSGVTIAFKSAWLASQAILRERAGATVDWEQDYDVPLKKGVDTFKTFVSAWYDTRLQDIIFHEHASPGIREMVCAILAGYAWDETNPYVQKPEKRLAALAEICKSA